MLRCQFLRNSTCCSKWETPCQGRGASIKILHNGPLKFSSIYPYTYPYIHVRSLFLPKRRFLPLEQARVELGARTLDPLTFDPPSHAHVCADCPGARRTPHLHTGAHCFAAISGAAERRRSCVFASSPREKLDLRRVTCARTCTLGHAPRPSQGKLTGGSGCRRTLARTIQRDYLHGAQKLFRLACVFSTRESKPPARRWVSAASKRNVFFVCFFFARTRCSSSSELARRRSRAGTATMKTMTQTNALNSSGGETGVGVAMATADSLSHRIP